MSDAFDRLSPAEIECLAMLAEEAGEIVQAIGKVLRHGYESRPPLGGPTNRQQLFRELGDLVAIVHGMMWAGDLPELRELTDDAGRWEAKLAYAHHQASEDRNNIDSTAAVRMAGGLGVAASCGDLK